MTQELLPCPFCGSNDLELVHKYKVRYGVVCNGCSTSTDNSCKTPEEALNFWNTRSPAPGSCTWVKVESEKDLPEAGIRVPWKYRYTAQPIQYTVGGRGGLKDHLPIIQKGEIEIWWLDESHTPLLPSLEECMEYMYKEYAAWGNEIANNNRIASFTNVLKFAKTPKQ